MTGQNKIISSRPCRSTWNGNATTPRYLPWCKSIGHQPFEQDRLEFCPREVDRSSTIGKEDVSIEPRYVDDATTHV